MAESKSKVLNTNNSIPEFRRALSEDCSTVSEILNEAAKWLEEKGQRLWVSTELSEKEISADVDAGLYWLVISEELPIACFRYQHRDMEFWDDIPHDDSAFLHRIAVRRRFAGRGIPQKIVDFAVAKARREKKRYLRLDCADRPKLRAIYEEMGFRYHSKKERNPYLVVRYEYVLD